MAERGLCLAVGQNGLLYDLSLYECERNVLRSITWSNISYILPTFSCECVFSERFVSRSCLLLNLSILFYKYITVHIFPAG